MGAVLGIDPTVVDDSDLHGVGVMGTSDGVNHYRYVSFDESVADGQVGTIDESYNFALADTTETAPGNGQGLDVGVARATGTSSQFGWVQVYGAGDVQVAASCAAYTELNSTGTGGQIDDDATAGAEVIPGIVLDTAQGGSAGTQSGKISFPYVGRTL